MPACRKRGGLLRGYDGKNYRLLDYLNTKNKVKMEIRNHQKYFSGAADPGLPE
jgi:hypothetical protein